MSWTSPLTVARTIRPLPPHFLQGGGNTRRPSSAGCLTEGNPVPAQAGQCCSATSAALSDFLVCSLIWIKSSQQEQWWTVTGRVGLVTVINPWPCIGCTNQGRGKLTDSDPNGRMPMAFHRRRDLPTPAYPSYSDHHQNKNGGALPRRPKNRQPIAAELTSRCRSSAAVAPSAARRRRPGSRPSSSRCDCCCACHASGPPSTAAPRC